MTGRQPITFEPIQHRRAFEEICQRIRDQLSAGALRPGDKLPPERNLAQQLGVGRSALREALRSLEIAGIVRLQKGAKGGAFIRQGDPSGMTQALQDLLHLGSISLQELTEARLYIQDVVVRLACERATRDDLDALRENVDETERVVKQGEYLARIECSREFYRLLAAATHNQVVSIIVEAVTEILMRFLRIQVAAGAKTKPNLVEARRRFLSALAERHPDRAVTEMSAHLKAVHRLLEGNQSSTVRQQAQARRGASAPAAAR